MIRGGESAGGAEAGGGGEVSYSAAVPFRAELDLSELDERGRTGPTWTGRGCMLSRGSLVFRSRRMCYPGRHIVLAVHLLDDRPVPLFGRVSSCEYDDEGMYRTRLELMKLPGSRGVSEWIRERRAEGRL